MAVGPAKRLKIKQLQEVMGASAAGAVRGKPADAY
jgi:hypothetical protein